MWTQKSNPITPCFGPRLFRSFFINFDILVLLWFCYFLAISRNGQALTRIKSQSYLFNTFWMNRKKVDFKPDFFNNFRNLQKSLEIFFLKILTLNLFWSNGLFSSRVHSCYFKIKVEHCKFILKLVWNSWILLNVKPCNAAGYRAEIHIVAIIFTTGTKYAYNVSFNWDQICLQSSKYLSCEIHPESMQAYLIAIERDCNLQANIVRFRFQIASIFSPDCYHDRKYIGPLFEQDWKHFRSQSFLSMQAYLVPVIYYCNHIESTLNPFPQIPETKSRHREPFLTILRIISNWIIIWKLDWYPCDGHIVTNFGHSGR